MLFLILGAITTIAVAWGCAMWVDRGQAKIVEGRTMQGYIWVVRRGSAPGSEFVLWVKTYGDFVVAFPGEGNWPPDLIPSWSTISHEINPAGPKRYGFQSQMQDARGWPMLSMRCTFICARPPLLLLYGHKVVGGRELPRRTRQGERLSTATLRALPYIPIPLGSVVNTLFYATILWLPFAPFQLRRYMRIKRGHCIKCGYDLRGTVHEVCPECGSGIIQSTEL